YKTTKWIVATFCLAVLVFGCEVENVIQNNLTIDGFIFYATLMLFYDGITLLECALTPKNGACIVTIIIPI
ncbi:hypothetical protein M4D58_25275, partial [Brevibacillus borstelensis]|uniref:hypothetical protein n=1 Tax=Brevibacillus borstelensis TaxID=45462 RepID=UPI00203F7B09